MGQFNNEAQENQDAEIMVVDVQAENEKLSHTETAFMEEYMEADKTWRRENRDQLEEIWLRLKDATDDSEE